MPSSGNMSVCSVQRGHDQSRLLTVQELDEDDADFQKFQREASSLQAQASVFISIPWHPGLDVLTLHMDCVMGPQ